MIGLFCQYLQPIVDGFCAQKLPNDAHPFIVDDCTSVTSVPSYNAHYVLGIFDVVERFISRAVLRPDF